MNLSREEFAEEVAEACLTAYPSASVELDRKLFSLKFRRIDADYVSTVYLPSHYFLYENEPERIQEIVTSIVSTASGGSLVPETFEEAKGHLRIHIQDRWLWEQQRSCYSETVPQNDGAVEGKDFNVPCQNFAENFSLVIAYDLPDKRCIVLTEDLNRWNLSFSAVLSFAAKQLSTCSVAPFEKLIDDVNEPPNETLLYSANWNDSYDAARVWIHSLINPLKVKGRKIAILPTAEQLLITGSDDFFGANYSFYEYKFQRLEGIKPLPPFPLTFLNGEPVRYQLDVKSPFYESVKTEQNHYWQRTYDMQAELMRRRIKNRAEDLEVAEYTLLDTSNELATLSICTVFEGHSMSIPKTDFVQFARWIDTIGFVILANCEWDKVMAVCNKNIRAHDDLYPPRYLISKFPTDSQLKKCDTQEWRHQNF